MEKLDRLGWAAGICINAYGLRIGIRVNKPEVLDQLADYLPPAWEQADSLIVEHLYSLKVGGVGLRANLRQFHLLYSGLTLLTRTMDWNEVGNWLESDLGWMVAQFARNRVFVHAGVVGWRGRGIMIPGRSYSGKSTLVAALLRAGATYYSDEYAVLDDQGYVHPYPRRLSLRPPNDDSPQRLRPEDLGSRSGVQRLPIGLIVHTRYKDGARWRPRPLSQGRTAFELLNHTASTLRRPEATLAILQEVVLSSANLKGVRGEADETAQILLRQVES